MNNHCTRCRRIIPQELLSPLFISSEGVTEDVCGMCALDISNEALGLERTEFQGKVAESMRQQAYAYYKGTNQL